MTDIGVFSQAYQVEDRSWLLNEFEDIFSVGGTLDLSKFTAATHFPKGYIPSGTVLGTVTASGLLGPYDDTATDGRQTAAGILVSSVRVLNPDYTPLTKVGVAIAVYNTVVSVSKLPFNSTNAATGRGYIDANGQADLKFVMFAA